MQWYTERVEQVNPNPISASITPVPPPVVRLRKPHMGKQKLPENRRRVILSVRVMPTTMEYLEKMGYRTNGRALDVLVKAVQHGGIREMIDRKKDFKIISLAD